MAKEQYFFKYTNFEDNKELWLGIEEVHTEKSLQTLEVFCNWMPAICKVFYKTEKDRGLAL